MSMLTLTILVQVYDVRYGSYKSACSLELRLSAMPVSLLTTILKGPLTFWESLPLLSCETFLVPRELVEITEKVFSSELINIYRRVLREALEHEISMILTLDSLDKRKVAKCALIFLSRLVESEVIFKCVDTIEVLAKFYREDLRQVYSSVRDYLIREIVERLRYVYSEDVVYAISALLDRDLWIIDKVRRLGVKSLVSVFRRKAGYMLAMFNDVSITLTFIVVSILAGLLHAVPMSIMQKIRKENINELVRWGRKLAEDLSELMELLDGTLIGELDPEDEALCHLDAAKHFLNEAEKMLSEVKHVEDPYLQRIYLAQVCEKLYKVAEECLKALAVKYTKELSKYVRELREVVSEGRRRIVRWSLGVIDDVADALTSEFKDDLFRSVWYVARVLLHMDGFHELNPRRLEVSFIERKRDDIRRLLEKTEQMLMQSKVS